jgi:predicted nucleic acid-binding protein
MISDTDLLDANVWLALAANKHIHHARAKAWFTSRGDRRCAFCRVTQFALLRHLTNRAIMGPNVRTPAEAWALYVATSGKQDVETQWFA